MRKRLVSAVAGAVLSAVIAVQSIPAPKASALTFTPNTTVQSESAVLYNIDVGTTVYEKNAAAR